MKLTVLASVSVLLALTVGCGSDQANEAELAAALGNPCQPNIDDNLAELEQPNEILVDSITFDDGEVMLIEAHVYRDDGVTYSFGYTVGTSVCSSWIEGITS